MAKRNLRRLIGFSSKFGFTSASGKHKSWQPTLLNNSSGGCFKNFFQFVSPSLIYLDWSQNPKRKKIWKPRWMNFCLKSEATKWDKNEDLRFFFVKEGLLENDGEKNRWWFSFSFNLLMICMSLLSLYTFFFLSLSFTPPWFHFLSCSLSASNVSLSPLYL